MEQINLVDEKLESDKYLTFCLGDEIYGLDIQYVEDIIGIQMITDVPEQPEYLKGVINLRGSIIPVMDIRIRFEKELRAYDDRTCIIVVSIDDSPIGIVVDTVLEVLNISEEQIAEPPQFEDSSSNQYMLGIGHLEERLVIIVDCAALINEI
jgi:purine-binding chemotaxis protein CheW